ncbi:hypothetical protein ACFIOY_14110 [Bradyrhizobium sp. TZ2]
MERSLGIAGSLRRTERFDIFRDRIFIGAGERHARGDAHEAKGRHRQGELTTIDIHWRPPLFVMKPVLQPPAVLSSAARG